MAFSQFQRSLGKSSDDGHQYGHYGINQDSNRLNGSRGNDNNYDGSDYQDRGRERDREHRDMRSKDDRDRGRDRDRRRDQDRGGRRGDWGGDRDDDYGRGGRHKDHNRDRSPMVNNSDSRSSIYSESNDDDYGGDDNDRGSSSSSDRYRGSRGSEDKGGEKWVSNLPSRTIILRHLSQDIDEKVIGAELMMVGLPVKDIRLIRRQSGVSRGFAFVEFHNIGDAQRWMEHTQGSLLLLGQHRATMAFSITQGNNSGSGGSGRGGNSSGRENNMMQRNDWVCSKCHGHNFKRRDFCYNCNVSRKESEKCLTGDGQEEVGSTPCNTLLFRGLDALTTEEGLVTGLTTAFTPTTLAPIKNVAIIRDEMGTSRGFGFLEFHSVTASTSVFERIKSLNPALEVDGKQLLIDYSKNTFNTTMAYIQQQQSQYYDQSYYQNYYDNYQYYDYSQYYGTTTTTATTGTPTLSKDANSTNSAAAVAQAAIQQAQAAKQYQKQVQQQITGSSSATSPTSGSSTGGHKTVTVDGVEYPVYPPPDTTTYQYEETSGYYYDPLTQLYYDANSQYYYNSTSGSYMYWDAEKSTYLPAPSGDGSSGHDQDGQDKKDGKEDRKDKEKVKVAKRIAKDMEKWAKSLNAQKEALKEGTKRVGVQQATSKQESAAADAGFAILTKSKEDTSLMPPPPFAKPDKPQVPPSKPGLVASYGGDSDSGGEEEESPAPIDESKLVDWTKLACLLCKRQFQSKEILSKHTQVSDLHRDNLEALKQKKSAASASKIEYRDRAKERRLKYGAPEPPAPRKRRDDDFEMPEPVAYEPPTKKAIGGDNIGNKLLQKMGWSHGQGLGKKNQGRTDPIEARRRNQMAGLGARGSNVVAEAGDSYREALKKTMFARYNEAD